MKTVINVPWVFTIVLFSALVLSLFIPVFRSQDHAFLGFVLMIVTAISGIALEAYFYENGWRKR